MPFEINRRNKIIKLKACKCNNEIKHDINIKLNKHIKIKLHVFISLLKAILIIL